MSDKISSTLMSQEDKEKFWEENGEVKPDIYISPTMLAVLSSVLYPFGLTPRVDVQSATIKLVKLDKPSIKSLAYRKILIAIKYLYEQIETLKH